MKTIITLMAAMFLATMAAPAQTTLHVTAPNGGETVRIGQRVTVRWTTTGNADQVSLLLSSDGGATFRLLPSVGLFTGRLQNTGRFDWTIPSTVQPGTRYRIMVQALHRIGDPPGPPAQDISDANFIILGSAPVTVPSGPALTPQSSLKKEIQELERTEMREFYQKHPELVPPKGPQPDPSPIDMPGQGK